MKKRFIFMLLTISIILISQVNSLTTSLKNQYSPQETIIAGISGNILEPINPSQVEFRKENVLLALEYGLILANDTYYIWAISPREEGNYTLWINNVETTISGIQNKIDFSQNFSVSEGNVSFNFKPGSISTKKNFTIDFFSFSDFNKVIQVSFIDTTDITLKPGKNTLYFSIDSIYRTGQYFIRIENYTIPAFIYSSSSKNEYINPLSEISFIPEIISNSLSANSTFNKKVFITNKGNSTLKGVKLDYDNLIFSIDKDTFNLHAYSNDSFTISLLNPFTQNIFSVINAQHSSTSTGLPVSLTLNSPITIQGNGTNNDYSCDSLGGKKCLSSQSCVGNLIESSDGECCIGLCQENQSSSSSNTWITILVILILAAIGGFLFYKYKKVPKSSGSMKDTLKEIEMKKEKRLP